MTAISRVLATLGLPALAAMAFLSGAARPAVAIEFRWLGQDGHDSVGGHPGPAKNDFQDIHFAVRDIPPRRKIKQVTILGHGGGGWSSTGIEGKFLVDVVRKPGSSTVDLYVEPYMPETGREFELKLEFEDGEKVQLYCRGGRADPNLRAPGAGLAVRWEGPDGRDLVGLTPGVGPDGIEDIRVSFAKLSANAKIKAVSITGPGGAAWASGLNHEGHRNAEFLRKADDPTRGDLYLGIDRDLNGKTLKAIVVYEDDRSDVKTFVAGKGHPARALPRPPAPETPRGKLTARWLGQDGTQAEPGDVHVALEGLTPGRNIVAAVLTDSVLGTWGFRADGRSGIDLGGEPARLVIRRPGPTRADLLFPPYRDETGATFTLRVIDASGREEFVRFAGGPCDVAKRAPALPPGSATARPGDDLQTLANRNGTVTLAPGEHKLTRPLVLSRPVRISGEPGATLKFSQGPGDPAWTSAIKIHAGGTTLEGFSVRFVGPIRWDREVSYGPAVIGTTDNRDQPTRDPKHNLILARLDLESPPASSDKWEEATSLIRVISAASGRIERNTLKGGSIVFEGGPWSMVDNVYKGTPPRTFSNGVFAGKYTHDVVVARNKARDEGPSGKTWRFLVLTQRGAHDLIADNVVEGLGPREDDPIPHPNAPEVMLTEAYRLHFEGKPAAISADGRVVVIPKPQGPPAGVGDVVSILSGPQAGQWRSIAQPLGPQAYLLDEPIDRATDVVSIATGFVRETFSGNTIDSRGSGIAANLVLAGNLFGTRVVKNRLLGGGESVRLVAAPTEDPVHWGWSHAPFLGGLIEGNTLEDALRGGIGVEHGDQAKANKGRVYMSVELVDNVIRNGGGASASRARVASKHRGPSLQVGFGPSLDPGEMVVTERGTRVEGVARDVGVRAHAVINGRVVRDAPLETRRGDATSSR